MNNFNDENINISPERENGKKAREIDYSTAYEAVEGYLGNILNENEDEKLIPAAALALSIGRISTSILQRRLELGYGRAAKIIDRLEALGIISAPDGVKPRVCMITVDENNKVSRINEAWLDSLKDDGETDSGELWKLLDMALVELDTGDGQAEIEPATQVPELPEIEDKLIVDAARLAAESGKISTSILQRRLCIGYGKAARIIDDLERLGIISLPNGAQPRTTLLSKQEIEDVLERL